MCKSIMPVTVVLITVMLITVGLACNLRTPSPVVFQRQRLHNVSYREAFEAAEQALGEYFLIANRDVRSGVIRAVPSPAAQPIPGARIISNTLKTPRHARRIAQVHLRTDGPYVDIFCRVQLQELETAKFRAMERERGAYDQPADTPADAEAGTTPEQNAVWVNRSRDRALERRILAAISEKVQQK